MHHTIFWFKNKYPIWNISCKGENCKRYFENLSLFFKKSPLTDFFLLLSPPGSREGYLQQKCRKKKNFRVWEAISKLLKIVKAPSLRSDKGSVFGCYLAGSNLKLPFTVLCEWHLCHFLNDFWNYLFDFCFFCFFCFKYLYRLFPQKQDDGLPDVFWERHRDIPLLLHSFWKSVGSTECIWWKGRSFRDGVWFYRGMV